MGDITLTASTRRSLEQAQETATLIARTQERFGGKKVNSALDNAQAYFTAAGLDNRASDLSKLKDTMDQAISQVKAAIKGIEGVTKLAEQAKALAVAANSTTDTSQQTKLASQFNVMLTQLNDLVADSSYGGKNLINGTSASLVVTFDENSSHKLTVAGVRLDSSGLTMMTITTANWTDSTYISSAVSQVDAGLKTLRSQAETFGSNNTVLKVRLDFTDALVRTLDEGSGKLVNADANEEAANMLALQTRQQLGVTAMSIGQQSQQSILNLF